MVGLKLKKKKKKERGYNGLKSDYGRIEMKQYRHCMEI